MIELVPFGESLWIASAPQHRMLGIQLGARMTVVRLAGGGLAIHSPIALTPALRREIDALGSVRHLIAPNLYHHVYAGEHQRAWPDATLHGAPGLAKKRPDLRVDAVLGEGAPEDWKGSLEPHVIEGSDLRETVLVHAPSRTVVSADLVENFQRMDHLPTRLYLKAGGIWQKPGWSRFLRIVYRDHRAARRSLDALLERDWDRVILAHGDPIERDGRAIVREAYTWLRP